MARVSRTENAAKHFALAFALAAGVYALAFWWIEHRRVSHGPWTVEYSADARGQLRLKVDHAQLGIRGFQLAFAGAMAGRTNWSETMVFDSPYKTNAPAGGVLFLDLLYLPGSVTLSLEGHVVELLPRVLRLDRREIPWTAANPMTVPAAK